MSRLGMVLVGLVVASLTAGRAWSDPMVEAARKERERREALKAKRAQNPRPVTSRSTAPLTNETLKEATADSKGVSEVADDKANPTRAKTPAAKPTTATKDKDKDEKGEAHWKGRIADAKAAVDTAKVQLGEVKVRIGELRRNATAIDDPNIRYQQGQELRAAESSVAQLEAAVVAAERQVAAVREEGRRAGAPAGWLR